MNEMRFYSGGQVGMVAGDGGSLSFPGVISPSACLHIVNTVSDAVLSSSPKWSNIAIIPPVGLALEDIRGTLRRKQQCAFCGQQSWMDEIITCPGCQAQVFEGI